MPAKLKKSKKYNTVAELLAVPERWCQNHSAVNEKGEPVYPTSPKAVSWCLMGAMRKVHMERVHGKKYQAAYEALKNAIGNGAVTMYNDALRRTHKQILKIVEKAGI
jgi:hypothetical protein